MRPGRFTRRGLQRNVVRRIAGLVELLVGTTRPYGSGLRTLIEESLDPLCVIEAKASDGALDDEARTAFDRGGSCPRGVDSLVSLGRYDDGLGSLVASAKYEAWPLPLELLGRRLGMEVAATVAWPSSDASNARNPIVVPVPTCGWRRWHRGIDHTRVLACGVARELRLPIRRVLRCRWATPQVELGGDDRRREGGRFHACRNVGTSLRASQHVVLVDDVCTTGATLSAVASLLRSHGAHTVHAVVVARAGA